MHLMFHISSIHVCTQVIMDKNTYLHRSKVYTSTCGLADPKILLYHSIGCFKNLNMYVAWPEIGITDGICNFLEHYIPRVHRDTQRQIFLCEIFICIPGQRIYYKWFVLCGTRPICFSNCANRDSCGIVKHLICSEAPNLSSCWNILTIYNMWYSSDPYR